MDSLDLSDVIMGISFASGYFFGGLNIGVYISLRRRLRNKEITIETIESRFNEASGIDKVLNILSYPGRQIAYRIYNE